MLDTLKKFKMRCPECLDEGLIDVRCQVAISSEEIREKLNLIEKSNMKEISIYEFQVLDYLKTINKVVSISKISKAFDKSFITSKTTVDKLHEKGFIKQDIEASKQLQKDLYTLSDKGDRFITKILQLMDELIKKNSH
jgi:predicted transcriptional regulator